MYIGEAIRRARSYCPSEYTDGEMYTWCDEVSSMLAIEDRNVFLKKLITPDSKGDILLPEGVRFENVTAVEKDGKILTKADIRDGVPFKSCTGPVWVTYLAPYAPIRDVRYRGRVEFDMERSCMVIDSAGFMPGDSVRVSVNDTEAVLHIMEVEPCEGRWYLYVPSGTLSAAADSTADTGTDTGPAADTATGTDTGTTPSGGLYDSEDGELVRIVTEVTVCDAPYDGMYVDYLISKISLYQRDFATYAQFMALFNSRLSTYKKWITNQLPQAGGKLKNWW